MLLGVGHVGIVNPRHGGERVDMLESGSDMLKE